LQFTEKAKARMKALVDRARLMVLVTHDLATIESNCTKVAWMEKGQVRMLGEPKAVIASYRANFVYPKSNPAAA
jgi:ABC-type polysaccharide/polyol phosphate transport system ATPase subunit